MSKQLHSFGRLVKALPDAVAYLGTALLVIDQGIASLLNRASLLSEPSRVSVIALILASLVANTQMRMAPTQDIVSKVLELRGGVEELVPSSQEIDVVSLVRNSRHVRIMSLAGTKLAALGSQDMIDLLAERSRTVTLLLADPFSPAIIMRYEKDEPSTYETGIVGLERRIRLLADLKRSLPNRDKAALDVRIFSNYPTCSLVQGDKDMYAVIYAYKMRGSDCPKIHTTAGSGLFSRFLDDYFLKVYRDAVPIEDWCRANGG